MLNWPDMFRRVRLAYSLTQSELAERLGADPAQVGKWERGKFVPGYRIQRQIQRMLLRHDPSLSHDAVKLSPVAQAVLKWNDLCSVLAISGPAARAYGLTADEALDTDWRKCLPEETLEAGDWITNHPAWKSSEALGYKFKANRGGIWYKVVGLIVAPAGLVNWTAAPTGCTITTKSVCCPEILLKDNLPSWASLFGLLCVCSTLVDTCLKSGVI